MFKCTFLDVLYLTDYLSLITHNETRFFFRSRLKRLLLAVYYILHQVQRHRISDVFPALACFLTFQTGLLLLFVSAPFQAVVLFTCAPCVIWLSATLSGVFLRLPSLTFADLPNTAGAVSGV